jgi:hypothetical protein
MIQPLQHGLAQTLRSWLCDVMKISAREPAMNKQQQYGKIKEDQHDQNNFNAPETRQQTQSQNSGPKDREPPVEVSQGRESEAVSPEEESAEGDSSEGFIDETLLTDQDPNDTDADDEALVLDGVSREADVEDDEPETENAEIVGEENSKVAQRIKQKPTGTVIG